MTVIVIAYNVAKLLPRCLESIRCQTLSDFEAIVVDNASTDDAAKSIAPFLSDGRFRLISLERECGPGGARNAGLALARGTYVSFVDGDDWIDATYLEDLADALDTTNAEVANGGQVVMYDSPYRRRKTKAFYDRLVQMPGEYALRLTSGEIQNGVPMLASSLNKMFRRSFLEENVPRFVSDTFYEDQLHTYECYLEASKVICVPGGCYRYYRRLGSITQSFSRKNVDDMVRVYRLIRKLLKNRGRYRDLMTTYYRSLEHCFNLIVRQIFEYESSEASRKEHIKYALVSFNGLADLDEYLEACSSEMIRQHLQPGLESTAIN